MLQTVWLPFLFSLILSAISIPVIIRVAELKGLTDVPDNERKFHKKVTPTLGGIAIFFGTLVVYSGFNDLLRLSDLQFITSALIILFFAGIKDDLLILAPIKKLVIQFGCAVLITFLGNLRLNSLWGIMGYHEVSPVIGTLLTVFLIVSLINAFNLIDGINGLAGSLGLLACLCFGIWFAINNMSALSILSFSLSGALIGFLIFNYNRAKIFMGDTGSMAVGFIVAVLAIRFVEANRLHLDSVQFPLVNAPLVAFSVLALPIFDMFRVSFIRLGERRSPFSADRNHIHHLFVDNGVSHAKANCILFAINLSCIAIALPLNQFRSAWGIFILCLYLTAIYHIAGFILRKKAFSNLTESNRNIKPSQRSSLAPSSVHANRQ